jgi:hypothetical protein
MKVYTENISDKKGEIVEQVEIDTAHTINIIFVLEDEKQTKFRIAFNDDNIALEVFGDAQLMIAPSAANHIFITQKKFTKMGH